jgi:hypothetical protein
MRQRVRQDALASRRSTAALARADASTIGSAPEPRFLRPGGDGRYPFSPVSSQPSSSETGRSAGRSATQSRPRCGVTTPARGHRTRSVSRIVSRNALQMSEMADSNLIGDDCQEKSPIWGPAIQPSATAEKPLVSKKNLPSSDEFPAVIARSKATKQSRTAPQRWIASLRSQ